MKKLETLEQLKNELAEAEFYKREEIRTTGYVSAKTFKRVVALKKKLEER